MADVGMSVLANMVLLQSPGLMIFFGVLVVLFALLGQGVQRVIVPLLIFEATNPQVILWDDIEAGMHPSLVENVLKYLSKKDRQVVLSTHSIDVLSALAELEPRDSQTIVLRKSADDVLSHEILDMNSVRSLIDSNQDPRKAADLLALR